MLVNDRTSNHRTPPEPGRSSRHAIAIVSVIVAVALVTGAGAVAMRFFERKTSPASTTGAASTAGAVPTSAGNPAAPTHPAATSSSAADRVPTAKASSSDTAIPPQSWALTFSSTFDGSQLNSKVWTTCYPWATGGCTNFGNASDPEQEWYQASQDQVSGGSLHLVAQREATQGLDKAGAAKTYACRSGMVTTYPSLNFKYGYVQITAQIPFGKGLWPAFWLAATNQQWPPEVDILEHWGSQSASKVYLHPLTGARQGGTVSTPGLSAGWHTFGLYWTKTSLAWYYDGTQVFATSTGVPQQKMYLIANLAVDDASAGGCSGSLLIKSVKIWQPPN
jgi:beta-glucanase (GH16 family)